jgi:hypothetical protein
MRSTLNCKVEQTVIVEKNGHCVYKLTAQKYVHPPNDADIEMEISKLKNGKTTGCDKIVAKFIEEGMRRAQEGNF